MQTLICIILESRVLCVLSSFFTFQLAWNFDLISCFIFFCLNILFLFCINTHTHLLYDYRVIYNIRKIMKSLDLVFDLILLTNLKRFDYRVKCAFLYFFKPTLGHKLYGAFTVNSISLTSTHSRFLPHTLLHSRTQHTIFLCTSIRIYTRDWIVKFFMFRISPVFFILFQFF